MDDHGDLAPVAGDVWQVREYGRRLIARGEELADTAAVISRLGASLEGQRGQFVDAAVSQFALIAGWVVRLAGVTTDAGRAAVRYADPLEDGQLAANSAIVEDLELHHRYRVLSEQARQLEYQESSSSQLGGWAWSSDPSEELRTVYAQMQVLVEAEEYARHRHRCAVEEVSEAAQVASFAFSALAQGPAAYDVPAVAGVTSTAGMQALAAGVVAAGLMGKLTQADPDTWTFGGGQLSDAATQIQQLYATYGRDPVFYQGLMGEGEQAAAFLTFLDRASVSQNDQIRALALGLVTGARVNFALWTAPLQVSEQTRVGAGLVEAVDPTRPGQEVFAAYLLGGRPPVQVVAGASEALDKLARTEKGTIRPVGELGPRWAALGLLDAHDQDERLWLTGAVFTQVALHPQLAFNYLAPDDPTLAAQRTTLWFDRGAGPGMLSNPLADGGTGLYSAVLAAVAYGSQMDYGPEQACSARLMGTITHLLTDDDHGYTSADLGPHARAALITAYSPYLDGIGRQLRGLENLHPDNGLLKKYGRGGFETYVIGEQAMPVFDHDELVQVIEGLSQQETDRDVWAGVFAEHMRETGSLSAGLKQEQQEGLLDHAGSNVSAIWGKIDHSQLAAQEKSDAEIAAGMQAIATVSAGLVPAAPPVGIALSVVSSAGAEKLADHFALADEVKEMFYSDYSSRSEMLAVQFMRGAQSAGVGLPVGGPDFYYENLFPTPESIPVIANLARDFQAEMITERDEEETVK